MLISACIVMGAASTGCTPPSRSTQQEEKALYVLKGQSREAALDFQGAIDCYRRALENDPGNSVAHYHLAFLFEKSDKTAANAIYHFQEFLRLQNDSDQRAVIEQHIFSCKQVLAKEVAMIPMSGDEMSRQFKDLTRMNTTLREENKRLVLENQALRQQVPQPSPGLVRPDVSPTTSSAAPPPTTRPPATSRGSVTHTVKGGDTYYSIATRYGITTTVLQQANPGVDPRSLQIGQKLVVPVR